MYITLITILSLFDFGQAAQDACQQCQSDVTSLTKVLDKNPAELETFSRNLCFKEERCTKTVNDFLQRTKDAYKKTNVNSLALCGTLKMCTPSGQQAPVSLATKMNQAVLSVLSSLSNVVQKREIKWKQAFCQTCPKQLQPFTDFFNQNQIELEEKITKICKSVSKTGVPIRACQSFLDGLLEKAKQSECPLCPFICTQSSETSSKNKDKFEEIKANDLARTEEVSEKLAKVDEVIQDAEETFPYIMSKEADINAFCVLCITFSTKLPQYQTQIIDTLSTVIAEILFDENVINQHKIIDKLKESIGQNFESFITKYKNPEICQKQPILACSKNTFERVRKSLDEEQSKKNLKCDSCESFASYVAPILAKPNARRDLTDYFYKEIAIIFSAELLDNVGLNIYDLIQQVVDTTSDLMNQSGTCSKSDYCEARK